MFSGADFVILSASTALLLFSWLSTFYNYFFLSLLLSPGYSSFAFNYYKLALSASVHFYFYNCYYCFYFFYYDDKEVCSAVLYMPNAAVTLYGNW